MVAGADRRAGGYHARGDTLSRARTWHCDQHLVALARGHRRSPLVDHAEWLLGLIAERADITLAEILCHARERGIVTSISSLWRFFDAREISVKKSLRAAEQLRPDVAAAREEWKREQAKLDPDRLVFIDETGTNTAMTRLRGRCKRGERLIGHAP